MAILYYRIDAFNHEFGLESLYRQYEQEGDEQELRALQRRLELKQRRQVALNGASESSRRRATKVNDDYGFEDVDYTGSIVTTTADFSADMSFIDMYGDSKTYPIIVDTGSSNLAVAVKECSTCGVGKTDLELDLDEDYS